MAFDLKSISQKLTIYIMKTFLIIDANALIHRSFHALPPLKTPQGDPIGAVYGSTRILLKTFQTFSPDYVAACFDLADPTFRHQEYKDYKGTRSETPEDLGPQFAKAKELFKSLGIVCFEKSGFEADDLIGALAKKFEDQDLKIIIATGDLDTLQLVVDDKIVVYTFKKGMDDTIVYNKEGVVKRYGLLPNQMTDFKGLRGDPSDNIPGVKGIGEKGAIKLLTRFGSLEDIYKNIETPGFEPDKEITARIIDKLIDQKDQAIFSKYLATIRTDIDIDVDLKNLKFNLDLKKVIPLFTQWGFKNLISQIENNPSPDKEEKVENISTPTKSLEDFKKEISSNKKIYIYLDDSNIYILFEEKIFSGPLEQLISLKSVWEDDSIKKIGYDLKQLSRLLIDNDIELKGISHDIKIGSWLINPNRRDYSFEKIEEETLKNNKYSPTTAIEKISIFQKEKLEKLGLSSVFEKIELPLINILAQMESNGIILDTKYFEKINIDLTKEIKSLEKNIYKSAKEEFNLNSPKQLSEILFDKLKISTKGLKKTPKGVISTRETELQKLKKEHSIIELIIKYRELAKLQNTYINSLPKEVDPNTHRIHTTFNQTGTSTGRLSSQDPNLQNLPAQGKWAKETRSGFISEKGYEFLSLDYSQIELRIAASLSQDKKMLAAFSENKDIHTLTAAEINNVFFEEVTPQMRRDAKILNFGVLYGMGPRAFSQSAEIPLSEAKKFINQYYEDFSGVANWQEEILKKAEEKGFVETLTGRKRWLEDINSSNPKYKSMAERMAINLPIQGLASDIIKTATIEIIKYIEKENLEKEIKLLLQIHDELIFEIKKNLIEKAQKDITQIMENTFQLKGVSLKVDSNAGKNLGELK